jgi:beta-fructofuranosidase
MQDPIFFHPPDGWVGDVVPFTHGNTVHLYFLLDRRDPSKPGMPWHRYTTDDFAHYQYHGVALANGGPEERDLNAYTGCVIADDAGLLHAYYTGFNPWLTGPDQEPACQVIMHASATDPGGPWTKHPEHTFAAPAGYESVDWRDPFVFRASEGEPWQMLVSGRTDRGPSRRRGTLALLTSDDLISWTPTGDAWAPERHVMQECPDQFRIGNWWYLVFSEFSDRFATHYRMSASPSGPWSVPSFDTVDGRAMYAAKTAELHGRRYFIGWIPTRMGERDDGAWQWAGDLVVHEARQSADGTLSFRVPRSLRAEFKDQHDVDLTAVMGDWLGTDHGHRADVPDGYAVAVHSTTPDQFMLDVTIDIGPNTTECGVVLRASEDGQEGYLIRLEPKSGRMVFDRWPRAITGGEQWQVSGDVPHAVELERPADLRPGPHQLTVLVDATACVAYLDQSVAMSARMYDKRTGGIALFVGEGTAAFEHLTISTRPQGAHHQQPNTKEYS